MSVRSVWMLLSGLTSGISRGARESPRRRLHALLDRKMPSEQNTNDLTRQQWLLPGHCSDHGVTYAGRLQLDQGLRRKVEFRT